MILLFGGYALVYAAVAAGGKFATEPWAGLFEDAYTEQQSSVNPSYDGTGMSKADYFASTNPAERRAGLMPGPAGPTPIRRRTPSTGINLPGK